MRYTSWAIALIVALILMALLVGYETIYRFSNPELTQTQLGVHVLRNPLTWVTSVAIVVVMVLDKRR